MTENKQLHNRVMKELESDPGLNATHIAVAAGKGVISLSGDVESHFERERAENLVKKLLVLR